MEDRVSKYPGRVVLNPVEGQPNVFDVVRADEPVVEGTALNKENLLSDGTAELLGLTPSIATPDDAFDMLFNKNIENLVVEKHQTSTEWIAPKSLNQMFKVYVVGGGGAGGSTPGGFHRGGGGGSGYIGIGVYRIEEFTKIDIICGSGGEMNTSTYNGGDGGTSSFGTYLSASGGKGGMSGDIPPGNGGAGEAGGGGGGGYQGDYFPPTNGGSGGTYGGGGGGGGAQYTNTRYGGYGGNGGTYGGGGGSGNKLNVNYGQGGEYGGDGGFWNKKPEKGSQFRDPIFNLFGTINVETLQSQGNKGENYVDEEYVNMNTCGGGGGYGGNGGNGGRDGAGGGGGYGGNGGSNGGGGGGYGGNGGDGGGGCGGGGGGFFCNGGNGNGSGAGGGGGFFHDGGEPYKANDIVHSGSGGNGGVLIMYFKEPV